MKDSVTALILCGGRGSRMHNRDKGLIHFKDQPLVKHVIDRLTPQAESIIISCNRNIKEYREYNLTLIEDEIQDYAGPLRGILSAYEHLSSPYTLIVPCDTPYLPFDLVERLLKGMSTAEISCCHDGMQQQSLIFLVKTEIIPTIKSNLDKGCRSVRTWLADRDTVDVDFGNESAAFLNINDEQTLQES